MLTEIAKRLRLSWNLPNWKKQTEIDAIASEIESLAAQAGGNDDG